MAHDPRGDRLILFSGTDGYYAWSCEIKNNRWVELRTTRLPHPRANADMVHDLEGHQTILFGGYGCREFNNTWAFDLQQNTWTELAPVGDLHSP